MSFSPKPSSHPISNRRDGRAVHSKSGIQKSEHVADAKSLLTIRQTLVGCFGCLELCLYGIRKLVLTKKS